MIDLDPRALTEVRRILQVHVPNCEVRVFGSRISGTSRPYSDLDLALVGPEPLPLATLEALRDAFSQSDLPILVDVQDWHRIAPGFQAVILRRYERL